MKKLLAIFPLILLTAVLVSPRSAVKATEATIYFNSVPDTIPYANLLAILQAGGSFDLEEYKSNGGTFESFIQDLTNLYGDVLQIPDNLYKKLKEEWQTTRIKQDQSVFLMPWQKENFARQIAYDSKFYQKILDNYNEINTPNVYPNVDYNDVLSLINDYSAYFYWKNSSINSYYPNFTVPSINANGFSYVATSGGFANGFNNLDNTVTTKFVITDILSLYITGSADTYTFSLNNITPLNIFGDTSSPPHYVYNLTYMNSSPTINWYWYLDSYPLYSNYTYTGTLREVLDYISKYFRNVNIYVNNVPWAMGGSYEDTINVEFPDVIGTDYDDLAYDVVVPVNNDLAFDLTAILQYLYGGFANTFSEAFDFSKLWDIGGIVDTTTGEAVDGADADTKTKAIPIAKAIEDEATDDAEVTPSITPTPDPDGFPVITITPIPIDNALAGSTILAEIVDATQNALPSQLIDAFWGIVFICFFIGIIWTFHK